MKPKQKAAIQRKKISAKALTHKESDAAAQIDGPGISEVFGISEIHAFVKEKGLRQLDGEEVSGVNGTPDVINEVNITRTFPRLLFRRKLLRNV
ncbi:hypothetical protein CEXT_346081 [Caerostris extrusa]|uniref:Uncharacterized protein n=1 Tax=Caerostris extrusa TaxID=172846 RepID=A0AAV4T0J5_CAEEX|nr:hypothetical protein CEXT_346081 [Caerostris extrusa]